MSTEDVEQRLKLDPEETEATVWVCSDGDAKEEKRLQKKESRRPDLPLGCHFKNLEDEYVEGR